MNKEHIKTVILIVLVVNSVFLTSRLWIADYQYEQAEGANVEDLSYSEQPELYEQVKPESIVLTAVKNGDSWENDSETELNGDLQSIIENDEQNAYILHESQEAYTLAWDLLKERINERELLLDSVINDKQTLEHDENFLVYNFGDISPVELMLEEEYGISHYFEQDFDNILLTLSEDSPEIYLVDDTMTHGYPVNLSMSPNEMAKIKENLQEKSLNSANPLHPTQMAEMFLEVGVEFIDYDSYVEGTEDIFNLNYDDEQIVEHELNEELLTTMDDIGEYHYYLKEEITEQQQFYLLPDHNSLEYSPKRIEFEQLDRERLAQAFFLDLSFVRQIQERDGTSIFTDGQRGLRYYSGGGLQYNSPQVEDNAGVLDSTILLERGGQLISLYGGWRDNLRAVSFDIVENEYGLEPNGISELRYRYYHQGVPILGDYPLTLNLSGNKLVEYYRKIPSSMEQIQEDGEPITVERALHTWLEEEYRQVFDELPDGAAEFLEGEAELREGLQQVYNSVADINSISLAYRQVTCQAGDHYIVPVWKLTFEHGEKELLLAWDFTDEQFLNDLTRNQDWLE